MELRKKKIKEEREEREINVERKLERKKIIDEIILMIERVEEIECEMNEGFEKSEFEKMMV